MKFKQAFLEYPIQPAGYFNAGFLIQGAV